MKKRNIIIIIALTIVLLVIITCMLINYIKNKESKDNDNEQTFNKVSITIKGDTLSKTGATIIIKDENKTPYSFGNDYKLEKNIFGLWIALPLKSGYSVDGLYGHGANGITEMKIDWKDRYGELKKRKV